MSKLTHFSAEGQAHMVNIGNKKITHRVAIAQGCIGMKKKTLDLILKGDHKKGDVLAIARIAGIMAAKKTSDLIPLCHPIALSHINIDFSNNIEQSLITCIVKTETHDQTGVEMEALTAVQVSLLTIYDMCKSVDRGMTISNIELLEKNGGKSGLWQKKSSNKN